MKSFSSLDSSDLEGIDKALRCAGLEISEISREIVKFFEQSENRFFVAERLPIIGKVLIPDLEELLYRTNDSDLKLLSATVLLKLDSLAGVHLLLDSIRNDNRYIHLIVYSLAERRMAAATSPIIERLSGMDIEDEKNVDVAVSLLGALRLLIDEIPEQLLLKFRSSRLPWQIVSLLEREWFLRLQTKNRV